jgi:hypothetical protein
LVQARQEIMLYTRPGCHLCDDAAAELKRLARQLDVTVCEVDIMTDRQAHDRWWADIPVVVVGEQALPAPFDLGAVRLALLGQLRGQQ